VIFTVRNDCQWPYWNKALWLAHRCHCLPARHACGPVPWAAPLLFLNLCFTIVAKMATSADVSLGFRTMSEATSLYTVTIVVLLYNNSWLNFRACTRNLSPCLVKCVWCSAYYWFRLKKEQVTVFMHFWLAFCYFCCLFSLRYRCIWGMCGWDSVIFRP